MQGGTGSISGRGTEISLMQSGVPPNFFLNKIRLELSQRAAISGRKERKAKGLRGENANFRVLTSVFSSV